MRLSSLLISAGIISGLTTNSTVSHAKDLSRFTEQEAVAWAERTRYLRANCTRLLTNANRWEMTRKLVLSTVPALAASVPAVPEGDGFSYLDLAILYSGKRKGYEKAEWPQHLLTLAQSENPAAADLVGRLNSREVIPRILVATHVYDSVQEAAAARIGDDQRFENIPRLVLASSAPAFSISNPSYADRASLIMYSEGGEFVYPVRAREVFLMGGFEKNCLRRTLISLIQAAESAGLREMTIHWMSEFTYDYSRPPNPGALSGLKYQPGLTLHKFVDGLNDLILEEAPDLKLTGIPGTFRRLRDGNFPSANLRLNSNSSVLIRFILE